MSRRRKNTTTPIDSRVVTVEDPSSDIPSDETIGEALEGKCTIRLGKMLTIGKGTSQDLAHFEFANEYGFMPADASETAFAAYFLTAVRDRLAVIRSVPSQDPCDDCEDPDCPHFDLQIRPVPGFNFRVSLLQAMAGIIFDYADEVHFSPEGITACDISLEDSKELAAGTRLLASNPVLLEDAFADDEDLDDLDGLDDDEDDEDPFGPGTGGGRMVH